MSIVKACDIYIPNENIDKEKWAVVACDQYTSEEQYWEEVKEFVGEEPSTLKVIYPEVYLEEDKEKKAKRLNEINKNMEEYVQKGIIVPLKESMVLVERSIDKRKRVGVVCSIDLEEYDYNMDKNPLIRATEKTITSRIPPRLEIRKDALIELPHILILIDDNKKEIVEKLYQLKDTLQLVYDINLMKQGGNVKGYAINDKKLIEEFIKKITDNTKDGITMVVGDGNHSLATAKDHWNNVKENLSKEEVKNHPARYALVEIENIYDEGLDFFPIHRSLFNVNEEKFVKELTEKLNGEGTIKLYYKNEEKLVNCPKNTIETFKIVQKFIEDYLAENKETTVDYIYGENNLKCVCDQKEGLGILLNSIEKSDLFPYVAKKEVLPKKTFSMGNAYEKRYYIEGKIIK